MKAKLSRWARIAAVLLIATAVLSLGSCDAILSLLGGDTTVDLSKVTPSNLKATSTTATSVTLTWDSITGATGYRIYRDAGTGSFSKIGEVLSATYTDSTVTSSSVYKYTVSAYNANGEGPQSQALTVTTPATNQDASAAAVTAGIALLKQNPPDINGAQTMFAQAVLADPTNAQAVLWNAMMTVASQTVSTPMQTLASDYIGIIGYPTDMNSLFQSNGNGSPVWLALTIPTGYSYYYVGSTGGSYTYNPSTMTYTQVPAGTGSYNQTLSYAALPNINIPAAISNMDGDLTVSLGEYFIALAFNVISRNQTGFNALVDQVVDNILGPTVDQVVASLAGLGDDASIDITWDMFSSSDTFSTTSGWPMDAGGNPLTLTFGKAEFLAAAAYLQSVKTVALMGKSISIAFPAQAYWDALNPITNSTMYSGTSFPTAAFLAAIYALPTPFSSGFLSARADAAAILGQARTAYLAAMGNMDTALTQVLARTSTSAFSLRPSSPLFGTTNNAAIWTQSKDIMKFAKVYIAKATASVNDGTPLVSPTGYPLYISSTGAFDATGFFAYYSTAANWPTAADEGPASQTGYTTPPTAVAVNLKPMFSAPLFALDTLLELDANGEPVWYPFTVTFQIDQVEQLLVPPYTSLIYMPISASSTNVYTAISTANANVPNTATVLTQSYGTSLSAKTSTGPVTMTLYAPKVKDLTFGGTIPVTDQMIANLKQMAYTAITKNGANPTFSVSIFDNLFVKNGNGSLSAYLPTIPAFVAYNSWVPVGQTLSTLDLNGNGTPDTFNGQVYNGSFVTYYATKGSYWWAIPTDFQYCGTMFGGAY